MRSHQASPQGPNAFQRERAPGGLSRTGLLLLPLLWLSCSSQLAMASTPSQHKQGLDEHLSHGLRDSSPSHDECRGLFDICCRASTAAPSMADHPLGQAPLTGPATQSPAGSMSSALFGHTMKLFEPVLSLAAAAWCSSAASSASRLESSASSSTTCDATASWPGFPGIKYVFSFGDSYTSTNFDANDPSYPSPSNPMGNPSWPGQTSANGPNWIDYFTVRHNASLLQTYNIAVGGATVHSDIVPPLIPPAHSMHEQITNVFVPAYCEDKAPGAPGWAWDDTLFTIFIGINDVNGAYQRGPSGPDGTDALNHLIFREYAGLVGVLYENGARNFVFLNVPAIERSPLTTALGQWAVDLEGADVRQFNGMVRGLAERLKAQKADANVWLYDTYADWNTVMDNPGAFPETAIYKNTTEYCQAYEALWIGEPRPDYFDPSCGVAANEYLWLNNLHPTDPVHDMVASRVAALLQAGPNIC